MNPDGKFTRFDEQWIIVDGEHNTSPVGPFVSEAEAHAEYKRNQPSGQEYLRAPTVVRLLRPAHGRFVFGRFDSDDSALGVYPENGETLDD